MTSLATERVALQCGVYGKWWRLEEQGHRTMLRVTVLSNLSSDAELRYLNGAYIAGFRIGHQVRTSASGECEESTECSGSTLPAVRPTTPRGCRKVSACSLLVDCRSRISSAETGRFQVWADEVQDISDAAVRQACSVFAVCHHAAVGDFADEPNDEP